MVKCLGKTLHADDHCWFPWGSNYALIIPCRGHATIYRGDWLFGLHSVHGLNNPAMHYDIYTDLYLYSDIT